MDYVEQAGIRIAKPLYEFVNSEALPGTSIGADAFWSGFAGLLADLAPRCKALLDKRDSMQQQIDAWHLANKGKPADTEGYLQFPARDRLSGRRAGVGRGQHLQGRSGDRDPRRAAACGSGHQCPLCAECRECALGQPVRCAVRHRRDPGGWRRDPRPRLQQGARRQGRGQGSGDPRRGRAAGHRQPCGCGRLCGQGRRAGGRAEGWRARPG